MISNITNNTDITRLALLNLIQREWLQSQLSRILHGTLPCSPRRALPAARKRKGGTPLRMELVLDVVALQGAPPTTATKHDSETYVRLYRNFRHPHGHMHTHTHTHVRAPIAPTHPRHQETPETFDSAKTPCSARPDCPVYQRTTPTHQETTSIYKRERIHKIQKKIRRMRRPLHRSVPPTDTSAWPPDP